MPWSTFGGVFFMLIGLGVAWVGARVAHVNRAAAPNPDVPPMRIWSPAEAWLWRFAWTIMGLGFICLGLTTLHYSKGQYVVVPENAPLINHIIWVCGFVCLMGGFAALFACAMIFPARDRRERREEVDD